MNSKTPSTEESAKPCDEQQLDLFTTTQAGGLCGGSRTDGGLDGGNTGASPSNTAPDNSIGDYFQALRWGVDSLYLSYSGELLPDVLKRLKALKEKAQSKDELQQCQAQYPIGKHLFEVKDKGASLFPYVLEDGAFRIQLSRGGKLPMAYVRVSAAFLSHVGPKEAERQLRIILEELGGLSSGAQVSRIDLFLDFAWNGSAEWDRSAWVTRASGIDSYSEDGIFTGWVIGRGGIMLARLYHKLFQAKKIEAFYLLELWKEVGWNEGQPVWRLEFQIKREVLSQMKIGSLESVLSNLNGLWSYATTEWLRLTIPQDGDKTRSRWPIHPLWGYVSSIDWAADGGPLLRSFSPVRLPSDKRLHGMVLSLLVSFMASKGIEDAQSAWNALITETYRFHKKRAEAMGLTFETYVDRKLGIKARLYNSLLNDAKGLDRLDQDDLDNEAEAYRRASRG